MRKEVPTQYPGISKILVLSDDGKRVESLRGKKFKARRYQKRADGSLERIKRSFETLAEAKAFRLGAPIVETAPMPMETSTATPPPTPDDQTSSETMTFETLLGRQRKESSVPSVTT